MKWIKKLNDGVAAVESGVLFTIILIMVLGAFVQVMLRLLFDSGVLWGDIFLRHLVLWVGFIGASLATRDGKHINVDIFARYLKPPLKNYVQAFIDLVAATVTVYLVKAAWTFVMEERAYATTAFNDVPAWYFQIIIPVGFALMGVRFVIEALIKVSEARQAEGGQA